MSELSNFMRSIANRPRRAPVHTVELPKAKFTKLFSGRNILNGEDWGHVDFVHRTMGLDFNGNYSTECWCVQIYKRASSGCCGKRFADKIEAHEYFLRVTGAYVDVGEVVE